MSKLLLAKSHEVSLENRANKKKHMEEQMCKERAESY